MYSARDDIGSFLSASDSAAGLERGGIPQTAVVLRRPDFRSIAGRGLAPLLSPVRTLSEIPSRLDKRGIPRGAAGADRLSSADENAAPRISPEDLDEPRPFPGWEPVIVWLTIGCAVVPLIWGLML